MHRRVLAAALLGAATLWAGGCSDRSSSPAPATTSTPTATVDKSNSTSSPSGRLASPPGGSEATQQQAGGAVARLDQADTGAVHVARQTDELFAGWPQPSLVLLLTGRQNGYIEPCGCTGLANAKGGLARRHSLVRQLEQKGWPLLALDVGNQIRRFGRQPEIKFQATVEGLRSMGYDAIALGPDDLRLSVGELIASTAQTEAQQSPFVSSNTAVLDWSFTPRYQVFTAGDQKVAVTAVLGNQMRAQIASDEILQKPAADGLAEVLPLMEAEMPDLYVLLAHASKEETYELARQFPRFDVVLTAGGADEPPLGPEQIEGSEAIVVQVGNKAMYAGVLALYNDPQQRPRYQRVPIDARWSDSEDMLALMASYQDQLKQLGWSGLGLDPVAHPSGRAFVGSERCGGCHTVEYDIWYDTPHAHATDSLVNPSERVTLPRHHDPECVSCHVTGWHPQQYFPYRSGFVNIQATPHLQGNGCENCHGPGSAHVAAETGDVDLPEEEILKLREQMRLPLAAAEQSCAECHDLDNSPDFHVRGAFEEYWKQIEH